MLCTAPLAILVLGKQGPSGGIVMGRGAVGGCVCGAL